VKKKLGVLVLTLSSLVISAACASSGTSSKPKPPQADPEETWAKAGPSEPPSRPADAAAVQTARLASR
jgi:ABC-type oligopeptide transport system substrate-binding subunit